MIRSLRKRFIIITMISVLLVLTAILVTINVMNYREVINTTKQRMDMLEFSGGTFDSLKADAEKPSVKPDRKPDNFFGNDDRHMQEIPFNTRYFSVTFDSEGNITDTDVSSIASVDEDGAQEMALKLYEKGNTSGFIDDFNYRRVKNIGEPSSASDTDENSSSDTVTYLFLDCASALSSFRTFRNLTLMVGILGALAIYILVLFLSKLAMKPIADTYEKQKRFITDASHEIKTPLAIIEANTEVTEMESGETDWTKSIRRQIARLTSLTEKLVFLSRMDEDGYELDMHDFNLSNAVIETTASYIGVLESKNKTISLNVKPDLPYYGSRENICRMLSLLIDNAVKYSSDNAVITISLTDRTGSTQPVSMDHYLDDISDDNITYDDFSEDENAEIIPDDNKKEDNSAAAGRLRAADKKRRRPKSHGYILTLSNPCDQIAVGNLDILFERFYRSDPSRSSKTGGHGIGLSVVRAIAEAHNGKVHAESADGRSIVFTIRL